MKSSPSQENPLGILPVNQLLARFAIPSIIAMLVSALYNIVDQFFIGRSVGMLGNAATNVAFPLTITCTAISLMCGIGGAANFNLSLGSGENAYDCIWGHSGCSGLFTDLYRNHVPWISIPYPDHRRLQPNPCRR